MPVSSPRTRTRAATCFLALLGFDYCPHATVLATSLLQIHLFDCILRRLLYETTVFSRFRALAPILPSPVYLPQARVYVIVLSTVSSPNESHAHVNRSLLGLPHKYANASHGGNSLLRQCNVEHNRIDYIRSHTQLPGQMQMPLCTLIWYAHIRAGIAARIIRSQPYPSYLVQTNRTLADYSIFKETLEQEGKKQKNPVCGIANLKVRQRQYKNANRY